MQCPNCRLEQPETSETCPACGLIFAKWRERHPEWSPSKATPPKAATPEPQEISFQEDPLSDKLNLESKSPEPPPASAPSTSSGQAGAPQAGSGQPGSPAGAPGPGAGEPYIPPANRWSKPMIEREYQEFPVKKFVLIIGVLAVLGVGGAFLLPTMKGSYSTPQPMHSYDSIVGSATQVAEEPTWTQVPCGYPFDTCTPTPIATPQTIAGPSWTYYGRVLDELHLNPITGVQIIFSNNGVAVTALSNPKGEFQIAVPPLAGKETWEVELYHPNYREGYWAEDPDNFSQQDRLARAYDYQENEHYRGRDGGGGPPENLVFSMFPAQLTEEEQMWLRNSRPNQ